MLTDLVERASTQSRTWLEPTGRRWQHAQAVGRRSERLTTALSADERELVCAAAWLHDIGYAPALVDTGFHPVDGARWARRHGFPDAVCALVAHHTGAAAEAAERGLSVELSAFAAPAPEALDVVTFLDLTTAPDGSLTTPPARLAEILHRYGPDHPVHRAVQRSGPGLLASARRGRLALGLADVPVEGSDSTGA